MRLLRVISTMDPRVGGPAAGLRAITPVLQELGHTTEFLTMEAPGAGPAEIEGSPLHRVGPPANGYQFTPHLLPWLKQHAGRFDAVTVHGLWQYHGKAVRQALQGTGVPYYVYPHGMLDPWFRKAYPLKHAKKWLYWQLVERKVLRDAKAVLFTCEQERVLARKSFRPYRCNERVVRYGAAKPQLALEPAKQSFRQSIPALEERPYLLYLSRIHPKKGVELLLEAWGTLKESHGKRLPDLVIAGPCEDASYQATLLDTAKATGASERIHWVGMLTGAAKWGALAGAEAFVLPSHQENFGIAVAEALSVGSPVLISNQVNIWREIVEADAGIAAPDTREGTSELLSRWLALSTPEKSAMRAQAQHCFENRFEMHAVAKSLIDVLELKK